MIIYSGTKKEFLQDVYSNALEGKIYEEYNKKLHKHPSIGEDYSWINSYKDLYLVINDTDIPDNSGIAIEYQIPMTSNRIDFMITGYDEMNHKNVVIIELKQWQKIEEVEGVEDLVKTVTGGHLKQVPHPSVQVLDYANTLKAFNKSIQDEYINLSPCAYMHNYNFSNPDPALDIKFQKAIAYAPLFAGSDKQKLANFIKKHVKQGDNKQILYEIENGKLHPSKSLQDTIASMMQGNQEYIMIDDQKVAYRNILYYANKSKKDHHKRTVIVKGGPGTGKSVVAINLLAELTKQGLVVQYTSKNQAPRDVYSIKLKGTMKKKSVDLLFKGSGSYYDCEDSIFDALIVDEAHRLREKSGYRESVGFNQIKEIIHASICSIFFIDESQRVTFKDIGTVDEIKKWANIEGSEVYEYELTSQFRCNGSNGYLAWLDDVLEIHETANTTLEGINYDFKIFNSPTELYNQIVTLNNENHKSRLLAGYCWDWIKSGKTDTNEHDIKIGDFEMSWNLQSAKYTYAIDDSSINEVGCIHTSQGLEFDYVGVIIGNDMVFKDNRIVTDYTERAKTDQSLKGIKKLAKEDPDKAYKVADEIIKNTYRTLMTRGMKGCYIYCTDKALSNYLKERLEAK